MTPQDRDLIENVFARLAQAGNAPRDPDALALIRQRTAQLPDSAYDLVQAVLIQELALHHAQDQVAELERRVAANQAPASGGSFLGRSPWGSASVPASAPAYAPQPAQVYQPAPQPQPAAAPWAPTAAPGGGFLRNAATMAAGVAGGSLLADGILGLFGGHHYWGGGGFGGGGFGGFGTPGMGGGPWGGGGMNETVENVTVNNYNEQPGYDNQGGGDTSQNFDPGQNFDSGTQDANFDNGNFDNSGGGFDDSTDV